MIARIGYFPALDQATKDIQDENYRERFRPALKEQPGYVAAFMLESPGGERMSVSIWNSVEELEEGAKRANAKPLLPQHRGEDIPGPIRAELFSVIHADGI